MAREAHQEQEPFIRSSLEVDGFTGFQQLDEAGQPVGRVWVRAEANEGAIDRPKIEGEYTPEDLILARSEFIDDTYPALFGEEEMGDVARSFTPAELTTVLVTYESKLIRNGILRFTKTSKEDTDKE